jgi:hypothetical protein
MTLDVNEEFHEKKLLELRTLHMVRTLLSLSLPAAARCAPFGIALTSPTDPMNWMLCVGVHRSPHIST